MSLSEEDEILDILTILQWAIRELEPSYRECSDMIKRKNRGKSERSNGDKTGENNELIN